MLGTVLRLTHSGLQPASLVISDLRGTGDGERKYRAAGPPYVPAGSSVDLVYDTQVAVSYTSGTIRGFITAGHVTAQLIVHDDMQEAVGTRITGIVRVAPAWIQGDYTSIKAACDAETVPGTLILVMPGIYEEDPFTVAAGVHLDCWGIDVAAVKAKTTNPNDDLITLGNLSTVRKLNIIGPTNAFGVVVTGAGITGLLEGVAFLSGFGCVHTINGAGIYVRTGLMGAGLSYGLRAEAGSFGGFHGTVVRTTVRSLEAIGAGAFAVFSSVAFESSGTCLYVENGGTLQGQGAYVQAITTALIHTGPGGGSVDVGGVARVHTNPNALDILQDDTNGLITLRGVTHEPVRIDAADFTKIAGYGNRAGSGIDPSLHIWSSLHVGTPGVGRELSTGQGDVTTLGARVYRYDGASYEDVSADAVTAGSPVTLFPNLNAGTAFYVGWQLDGGFKFYGLEFNTISQVLTLGGGAVVSEYWDGGAWTAFRFMITEEESPFLPQAMDVFQNNGGSEHLRFGQAMARGWVKNDPPGIGTDLFWVRFRITTGPITQAPIVDLVKMVPTRTRFDENGLREMDGLARVTKSLPWSLDEFGKVTGFGTAPADVDIWVSENIAVGLLENSFRATFDSRATRFGSLPSDIDTSSEIHLDWKWVPTDANAGDVEWALYWTYLPTGSVYSFVDPAAPHANEQSMTVVTSAPGVVRQEVTSEFIIDISGTRARTGGAGHGDILYLTIQRNAGVGSDTYGGDAVVVDVHATYLAYTDGVQAQ